MNLKILFYFSPLLHVYSGNGHTLGDLPQSTNTATAQGRNILRYRGRLCSFQQSASLQSAELRLQHVRLTVIPQ